MMIFYLTCSIKIIKITYTTRKSSLVTNFSDQKLLVTIITNLDTSLQSKKIFGY